MQLPYIFCVDKILKRNIHPPPSPDTTPCMWVFHFKFLPFSSQVSAMYNLKKISEITQDVKLKQWLCKKYLNVLVKKEEIFQFNLHVYWFLNNTSCFRLDRYLLYIKRPYGFNNFLVTVIVTIYTIMCKNLNLTTAYIIAAIM